MHDLFRYFFALFAHELAERVLNSKTGRPNYIKLLTFTSCERIVAYSQVMHCKWKAVLKAV